MPIRLRLAVAFAVIAAALYALGGWLFARGISVSGGESQPADRQLAQAGRSGRCECVQVIDPAGVSEREHRRRKRPPGTASQLSQARQGRIWLTRTVDEESRGSPPRRSAATGWVAVAAESLETSTRRP